MTRQSYVLSKQLSKKKDIRSSRRATGSEAYKLLQSGEPFVAAIFDVVMPYIQGTELVRYMQSEKRLMKIPVIMMTAEQNPRLSSDSFAAGAVPFCRNRLRPRSCRTMLRMFVQKIGQQRMRKRNSS